MRLYYRNIRHIGDVAKEMRQKLLAFCKDHIASYKKPKSVDFVDALPKNNSGKISKRELWGKYWEDKERKV